MATRTIVHNGKPPVIFIRSTGTRVPDPIVESVVELDSSSAGTSAPTSGYVTVTPVTRIQEKAVPSFDTDDEEQEMIEAFEYAAELDDDSSDHVLEIAISPDVSLAEHDYTRLEDDSSQGSSVRTGDELGSQGQGQSVIRSKRSYIRHKGDAEKRRRRQEEVNRAVQQCRLKRKAMLTGMKEELDLLRATYKRLQLRSHVLDSDMVWPSFTPKPYPPELESRRHARRGARYKAESEDERKERVRLQNNQAQFRKALRNKFDEENMRDEINFLKDTNSTMRKFIHHRLRNKRMSDETYNY